MTGGTQAPPLGQPVPELAQLRLRRRRRRVDDLRLERLDAVLGVGVRLGAPEAVVHVDRANPIPERPESVPEARRVGAARHEARDLAAPRDQLPGPDVRLDALEHVHGRSVPNRGAITLVARRPGRRSAGQVVEARRARPREEGLGRALDGLGVECVGRRVRHGHDPRGGEAAVRGIEDVPNRQGVGDGHHDVLGPGEEQVERVRDPLSGLHPALAPARARRARLVRPGPRAVVRQGPSFVGAEPDLVEPRKDDALHVPGGQRELERLLRPREPGRDTETDRLVGQRLAQGERLRDAVLGEALAGRRRADAVGGVGPRVRMSNEQEPVQKSTLR